MSDVKNSDSIFQYAIENLVRIPDQRKNADSGHRGNARRRPRTFGDEIDDVSDTGFKRQGNEVTKGSATVG